MNKFKNPKKVADEMIDIISPLFNASKTVKLAIGIQIGIKSDEEVSEYLSSVLKFLVKEYKSE